MFGHDYTVGIEEELLLVDPVSGSLAPLAASVLASVALPRSRVDHELFAAELEVRSEPCERVEEAIADIADGRGEVSRAGGTVIGSGLHPTAALGDAQLTDDPRYEHVTRLVGGLTSRTPEAALQVHVGLPDREVAVRVLNGLRELLPVFIGLAANSPWHLGKPTAMSSFRYAIVRPYPTRCAPPHCDSYFDYSARVEEIIRYGALPDYTYVYWDVRLQPRLGTVEIREMDAQADLVTIAGIAAFAQSVCIALGTGRMALAPSSSEALSWSCFRAARDGLEATIYHQGHEIPLRALVGALVDELMPVARQRKSGSTLNGLRSTLEVGGGAAFQRRLGEEGGAEMLVASLIDATRKGSY